MAKGTSRMPTLKDELILSLMREKIKRVLYNETELSLAQSNKLTDKILHIITETSKEL